MVFKVFGRKIKIKIVDSLDNDDFGEYNHMEKTIKLAKKTLKNDDLAKSVLIHELTHAILGIGGLSNIFTSEQEEAICDAMEEFNNLREKIGEIQW